MHCFNHPRNDAVGICRACGKGICADCIVPTEHGLTCSPKCSDRSEAVDAMIDRNLKLSAPVGSMWQRTGNVYLVMRRVYIGIGVVVILFGVGIVVTCPVKSPIFPVAAGLAAGFGLLGLILLTAGLRIKNPMADMPIGDDSGGPQTAERKALP